MSYVRKYMLQPHFEQPNMVGKMEMAQIHTRIKNADVWLDKYYNAESAKYTYRVKTSTGKNLCTPVSKETYVRLRDTFGSPEVHKTTERYRSGEILYMLNTYQSKEQVVDVFFDSLDASCNFIAPPWLGQEVTGSPKYDDTYVRQMA